MPTLEERAEESARDLRTRLAARMDELKVTRSMANYIEMMEIYLLKLERRVARLEENHGLDPEDLFPD